MHEDDSNNEQRQPRNGNDGHVGRGKEEATASIVCIMIRMSDKATTDNERMIFNGGVFVRRYLFAIPVLLLLLHLPRIMSCCCDAMRSKGMAAARVRGVDRALLSIRKYV